MPLDLIRLPKAELHLHLEGSILPETLREMRPSLSLEAILERYRYDDFVGFLQSYKWVTAFLEVPEDYALITSRLLDSLASQNVQYLELNVSVGVMLWRNQDARANFQAIHEAASRSPIPVRYIFDAVRQFGVEAAGKVAELAVALQSHNIVGYGLGGDEARGPAPAFAEISRYITHAGLRFVPHAGETTGPKSIWEALESGAARIGHGIRAVEDPVLVRHLAGHNIPLEISVTSNLCTRCVSDMAAHPLRALWDQGVPVVLNTDDPAMFHTTLVAEYELARSRFGFSDSELEQLATNSFRYGFDVPEGLPAA